jgi:hypothetical protein
VSSALEDACATRAPAGARARFVTPVAVPDDHGHGSKRGVARRRCRSRRLLNLIIIRPTWRTEAACQSALTHSRMPPGPSAESLACRSWSVPTRGEAGSCAKRFIAIAFAQSSSSCANQLKRGCAINGSPNWQLGVAAAAGHERRATSRHANLRRAGDSVDGLAAVRVNRRNVRQIGRGGVYDASRGSAGATRDTRASGVQRTPLC